MNLIWIFIFFTVKNSYLIYVLLKNSIFFYNILMYNFIKTNTKTNLKIGSKNSDWKFNKDNKLKEIFRGNKTKS